MKIVVDNKLVEYGDEGSGGVILMLHGWGTDMSTFDQIANHLKKKFRVIRLDFPGFGKSPNPAQDWSVDDYAKLTRDFVNKLNVDHLYAVVGHSFGGRVIIKGISQEYLEPQKVVLIGTAGVKPNITVKKAVYKIIAKLGKITTSAPGINKLQPLLRKKLYASAGSVDYLNAKQMQKTFLKVVNEDLLPLISKVKQPVLLVWGENDLETPVSDAKLMVEKLDNGQLKVIPNAGHFVHVEALQSVSAELDKFL